jgi:hypothetical protein
VVGLDIVMNLMIKEMLIFNKTIEYKDWIFKSNLEYEFCLYLEQLQEAGFIRSFGYESVKFNLSPSVYSYYLKQLKTKVKEETEFLMRENTYQPDFTVVWENKSNNLLYLDRTTPIICKVTDIPFRLAKDSVYVGEENIISFLEVKPIFEGKLDSSKEFPLIQKQLWQDQGIFVQKIKPENLFKETFVPDKLIASNVYQKQSKFCTRGSSKYKFNVRTLEEYLKLRGYDNK